MIIIYPRNISHPFTKSISFILFLFFTLRLFGQTYDAELMNYVSYYTIKHNTLYQSDTIILKINNPEGNIYTNIKLPYSENAPIYALKAWVEDVNGKKIRKLKHDEIADIANVDRSTLYDDIRAKIFELKNNTYPYIIKYTYRCKKKDFVSICTWYPVYVRIPAHNATLHLDVPAGYKISFHQNKIDAPFKDSTKNGITLIWHTAYENPMIPQIYLPSVNELYPNVMVVPEKFTYGINGSQQNWEALGNWDYDLNKGLDDLPPGEIQKVKDLIQGIEDKKLIIAKLYKYLQDNTRYESVQIGVGGFKCFPANFVAEKKYGDCKGLANYMKALLKVAGIPSYTALVYGGNEQGTYRTTPDFVAATQFNHVILCVPLDKDTVWLDCTSKINPAGYLGSFSQNRYALVINENNSKLIKTPAFNPSNCYTLHHNTMRIDTDGNVLLKSFTEYKGYGFEITKLYSTELSKDKQKEYRDQMIPYQDFTIKHLDIKNEGRDSTGIMVDYQIILKNSVTKTNKYLLLQLDEHRIPVFETPSKRHFPVYLAWPIHLIDTTEIIIPDKYKAVVNKDEHVTTHYGKFNITYTLHDNKMKICRNILVNAGEYSLEEYPDFYHFITSLREILDTPFSFIKL